MSGNDWLIVLLVILLIVLAVVITVFLTYRKINRKMEYMLDALEDKEVGFRFREKKHGLNHFNRALNRLRSIFDNEMKEISEQDKYYGKMLDNISTGIVVLSQSEDGRIIYSNQAAINMLGMPSIGNIRQLGTIDSSLEEAFANVSDNEELRCSFYNERNRITISLAATFATLDKSDVKIVTFNDITGDIAHSEELSWNKLIRVLTHEIMNTVTPIASLSDTLSKDVAAAQESVGSGNPVRTSDDSENNNTEITDQTRALNMEELRSGLDTIASSSRGLIKFVDNYRNLTRVAAPVKKAFFVRDLIERVRQLTVEEIAAAGCSFNFIEKSEDILLYADENQIAQIIINMVKNAVQAGAKAIEIAAEINFAEQVIITISNNGRPISKESRDEIFVPFYTTKQDGSGIGLSLSRQIMRLHNGSIDLVRSDDRITTFSLSFK